MGVGPKPIRFKDLNVERLREVILCGVSSSSMQQKARELGHKLHAENGIQNAVNLIEKMLYTGV